MHANDLYEEYPTISVGDPAIDAARMIGSQRLPGVIVLGGHGAPVTVLPGPQVLNFLVPRYIQDDPSLAGAVGEWSAEQCASHLAGKTVGDLLPEFDHRKEVPVVGARATVLECAARMARLGTPLLAVKDGSRVLGVVTASRLVAVLLG